ncbi:MAG: helix-turn-helix transcriptional regulator [Candidatus Woesearchaeota archaeon]
MKRLKLKLKRIEKDLSQKDLAERIGLTNQTISDYERGKLNPSFKIMKAIADELNSSVDELFFNETN